MNNTNNSQFQKKIASRIGWNEGMVTELGPNGINFLLEMIERHESAERRLGEERQGNCASAEVQKCQYSPIMS
jgi:hypothetical protein